MQILILYWLVYCSQVDMRMLQTNWGRGGKQQQRQTSSNHVWAICGRSVKRFSSERVSVDTISFRSCYKLILDLHGWAKKFQLNSVTHGPSELMGCALAALRWWVAGRREIQTCRNYFAPSCSGIGAYVVTPPPSSEVMEGYKGVGWTWKMVMMYVFAWFLKHWTIWGFLEV